MIIGALISLLGLIALTVLQWLPQASTVPLPDGFVSSLDSMWTFLYGWNYVFPIDTMITIATYAALFWVAWIAVNAVFFIIALIRGN